MAPALEASGVREALAAYQRKALLRILVGFALLVPLGIVATLSEDKAETLERRGDRVAGRIIEVDRRLDVVGSVGVAYVYRGQNRASVVQLNPESPTYHIGDEVTVLIDPHDQDALTILGEDNLPPIVVLPMVVLVGLVLWTVTTGTVRLVHAVRRRAVLTVNPWVEHRVRATWFHRWPRLPRMVLLLRPDGPGDEVVAGTPGDGLAGEAGDEMQEVTRVEVAGRLGGYVVVRPVGSSAGMVSARTPRLAFNARAWRRAFDD